MQWWRAALAALALASACGGAGAGTGSETEQPLPSGALAEMIQRAMKRRTLSPKPPRRPLIPEAMRNLYNQLSAHNPLLPDAFLLPRSPLHKRMANTVRSFPHIETNVDRRFKEDHRFRLYFNVSVPDDEWLRSADIVLTRENIPKLPGGDGSVHRHRVLVFDIVKPGIKGKSQALLKLLDSKTVELYQNGNVNLDVTNAVERWLWKPDENHGILVQVVSPTHLKQYTHVRLRRAAGERRNAWRSKQPVLLAYTDDGRAPIVKPPSPSLIPARGKREIRNKHRRKDYRMTCQRRPLYVDFADVSWSDWIVAPSGYEAYYCHGECTFPLADHLNSTNHAIVQTIMNSRHPMSVPKACCIPTTLSPISMLYLDEQNKLVLKNYQDMAVVGCGCR